MRKIKEICSQWSVRLGMCGAFGYVALLEIFKSLNDKGLAVALVGFLHMPIFIIIWLLPYPIDAGLSTLWLEGGTLSQLIFGTSFYGIIGLLLGAFIDCIRRAKGKEGGIKK